MCMVPLITHRSARSFFEVRFPGAAVDIGSIGAIGGTRRVVPDDPCTWWHLVAPIMGDGGWAHCPGIVLVGGRELLNDRAAKGAYPAPHMDMEAVDSCWWCRRRETCLERYKQGGFGARTCPSGAMLGHADMRDPQVATSEGSHRKGAATCIARRPSCESACIDD